MGAWLFAVLQCVIFWQLISVGCDIAAYAEKPTTPEFRKQIAIFFLVGVMPLIWGFFTLWLIDKLFGTQLVISKS